MKANGEDVQLTFDVGGEHAVPASSSFRVSGSLLSVRNELMKGAEVKVVIWNEDGQVVAEGEGVVRGVAFHEHHPNNGPSWTERKHSIKLEV